MKKLNFVLSSLILAGSTVGNLSAAQSALIKVDLDRTIGAIDPNIYGSFLEPVGRGVVYGSLYDPTSPLADDNGFRKDYIQQIKELKVSAIRWPGGNFVSGYHWEDGIGPKDERPVSLDLSRRRTESNQMGTDEYAAFCNLVGITPEGDYKTSLYHSFHLYSNHCRGTALDVYTRCETYSNKVFKDIPYLDVTAVLNESDGTLVLKVVNRSETEAIPANIELQSGAYTGKGQVHLINADSIEATNTATEEKVRIETSDLEFTGNRISHTFPAHSLTQLEIALRK